MIPGSLLHLRADEFDAQRLVPRHQVVLLARKGLVVVLGRHHLLCQHQLHAARMHSQECAVKR